MTGLSKLDYPGLSQPENRNNLSPKFSQTCLSSLNTTLLTWEILSMRVEGGREYTMETPTTLTADNLM